MKVKLLLVLITATLLNSCGPYNKLLKSDDAMAQYDAAFKYYEKEKYERAKSLFDNALPALIGTAYEDTVLFTLGKVMYDSEDFEMAGETMNQYRNKFPRSDRTPEAEYIYAMSFYMISGDVEKDQTNTRRAIIAFGEYLNRHPESIFAPEIKLMTEELNNKLYYKKYLNAAIYFKLGHYYSAVTSLRALLKDHPETPYREDIMFLICKSWFEYAGNSVYARQLDRYLKMIDAYYNFKTTFPVSKQFDNKLEKMKDISQDFIDKNGVVSQSLETSATKIEDARTKIEDNKDKLFSAKTKEKRELLRFGIEEAREVIKVERKNMKAEEKILKANEKIKRIQVKEMEAEEKIAKKLEEAQRDEDIRQKREQRRQQNKIEKETGKEEKI